MNKKVLTILLVTVLLVGACALALAACAETSTTVTYYVDGSVYRTITVTGTGASDPGLVPVKEGYTFVGWYLDRNFTSPFNFRDYASNENRSSISVYAYFVPVQTGGDGGEEVITYRTVTFNVNGGDSEIQPREYQVGALMSLPVPEREGYTFIGWRDMFGDYYNAESVMPDEDITLTAVWEKKVTTFEDDYVMFAPATEGKKHDNDYYEAYRETIQTYLYVELTSDDLGGIDRVGKRNNFDLTQNVQMEFSVSSGYTLSWYEGNWNNPNGAQLFTLGYGSNIQLLTVSEGERVVKRYLVDIYVLHDYYVSLYEDIFDTEPYDTVRVIENQRFAADTEIKQHGGFEYDCRVYWNSLLEEYVPYTYTDRVTRDISLYQTYKEKTISVIDEEGTALESVSVKPYTQYSLITAPQKQGYDFLGFRVEGEEDDNDWYFADITGNTTLNYLSLEEDIDLLTAVFAPKKYYQYVSEDGSKLHVVPTVPVVLYTNRAQRSISEIIYVAEGSTVPLPSQAPFDPMDERESYFVGWGYYKRTSGGKWLGDDFLFYKTVEKPAAVYAITDVVTGGSADYPWYGISLDSERTFSSGERIDASYRVHLPVEATYTLTVTTTGRVEFTVSAYQDQTSHNYTATSSSPATVPIYWDWGDTTGSGGGTISFEVKSYSGSFTVKLTGPNAVNNEEYVTLDGENTIVYGQSATLIDPQNKVGYAYICTDESGNSLDSYIEEWTYENGQTFNITDEYIVLDRTITFDSCGGSQVDAITQATDTTIQLPTPEREGYVFLGWFYEKVPAALSEKVDIEVMPGVDITLYAAWADEEDAQYLTYTAGEEGIIITGYTGDNTVIKLPSEMLGLPVTSIESYAFEDCSGLTSITIPDSVTSIGSGAFSGCSGLESITIPFVGSSIKTASDTYQYPFGYIFGTSSYTGGVSTRQYYYGSSTSSRTSSDYYIPASLKSVTVTGGNILYGAFYGCYGLTSITIPDSIRSIGSSAFYDCSSLTSVTIPDSVTSIGSSAFYDCSSLTSVTIPDSVTSIGSSAFYDCSSLTSVTIPDSVTSIGSSAFSGCNSLTSITVPFVGFGGSSNTHFGYIFGASSYSDNSRYVPSSLKEVIITGGTSIGSSAFYGCSSLTSITIPDSVTSIGSSAFSGCSGLTGIIVEQGNVVYHSAGNCIIETASKTLITGCKNSEIPNDGSVTSIGNYAFSGCSGLTNITIPDSVTYIGEWAFYNCSGLTSITVPFVGSGDSSNIHFGYIFGASSYLNNSSYVPSTLKEVVITGGASIGEDAFRGCSGLTSITIPDSVTSIGRGAFEDCSGLTSITIPDGVTNIGVSTFYGCSGLTSIIIPDNVTNIERYAFSDCGGLTSIIIPDSVTSIGYSAFSRCSGLTSITIPFVGAGGSDNNHFGYIFGAESYLGSNHYVPSSLKEVIITGGTSIGSSAFYGCSSLTSITIPDSVTSIGSSAFRGCSGLTSITIPDSVTSIGSSAFRGCSGLTSITIPDSVTSIGSSAFSDCSGLTSVTISDSVTSIGEGAFSSCSGLESITIPFVGGSIKTASDTYQYPFGYIFGTDSYTGGVGTAQYYYGSSTSSTTSSYYHIPASLKSVTVTGGNILCGAFSYCSGLTSITIPDGVTSIGSSVFRGCSGLTSITIPDSVTSIGSSAFSDCSGLTSVTISDSVTSIGEGAFSSCSGLESITIPFVGGSIKTASDTYQYPFGYIFGTDSYTGGVGTAQYYYGSSTSSTTSSYYHIPASLKSVTVTGGNILYGAFYNCSDLTSITIPDSITSIGNSAFNGCSGLTSIAIPDSVTSIGDSAFKGCSGLTSITIPDSVTSIGDSAFSGCSGLTSITIPDSVTSIGNYAFNNCSGLTSITIPDSVTSIGEWAFAGCSDLTSITIPDSVTSIGLSAFSGCSGLTSIIIPDSVTSIGVNAFYGCSGLTSITILDSVTSIGLFAFSGCSGLTSINYNGTMAQWKAISKGSNWSYNTGNFTIICTDGTLDKSGNQIS